MLSRSMYTCIISRNLISLYFLTVSIKTSQSANLIGIQVLEMEDLAILQASQEVGNLAYGDDCRQNGVLAITEDICFHSNPMFQCVDGRCTCAFVKMGDERSFEQMQFENGTCKRPLNFECTSSEDCVHGLTCAGAKTTTDVPNSFTDLQPRNTREEDDQKPKDERLTSANLYRKRIKAKVKMIAEMNKNNQNKSVTAKSTRTTKELLDAKSDEIDMIEMDNDEEIRSEPAKTSIKMSMFCLKAESSSVFNFQFNNNSNVCVFILALIHYSIHLFFVKI